MSGRRDSEKEIGFRSLIFLTGFMGAGKTTVGRALASYLGYQFFDLDEFIERRAGKSIQQIFSDAGESEFRRIEHEAILECRGLENSVIALGGGAYVAEENHTAIREIGITVWLDCSLEICLDRLRGNTTRPLLKSESEMRTLLEKRKPAYALADNRVNTEGRTVNEVALEIAELVRK